MSNPKKSLLAICLLTGFALFVALPQQLKVDLTRFGIPLNREFSKLELSANVMGRQISFNPGINLGLDLQGGTHLVLNANMSAIDPEDRTNALESAKSIISRRIDAYGVAEPVIQTSVDQSAQQYRLIVELPGVTDVNQAIDLIGQTAQLEFREQDESLVTNEATMSALALFESFVPSGLTGKELKLASVTFDSQTGRPAVSLEFHSQGRELLKEITARNVNKPLAIFLDDLPISWPPPIVSTEISDGQAVISGNFTREEANNMVIQLNAGALPVPIEILSQKNVGATLGQDSVEKSLVAGMIGLFMVGLFMALYYGGMGILANVALVIYSILTLAAYKLIGVTITLPGLAGFILSVGMAVDSNILIFERIKEELRINKPMDKAIELGFGRAWDSIKDANAATLLICFILFNPFDWNFLNSSGMVRGFALTLTLGVLTSLFTGIIVSRNLIRLVYQQHK